MTSNVINDELIKKYSSIINSNANIAGSSSSFSLELTVEDIVRDKTILDRLDIIPNPFENKENMRINYPSFEEMFHSKKQKIQSTTTTPNHNPNNSNNSSVCSNRSNHNDSSTHFRWSIDQIARLLPAEIEYKLQDDTLTIFKPHDEETQHKIDEYFSNTALPSPYTPDSKKVSPASILTRLDEFFMEPSPTELYISHGTNGKFLQNKHLYNVAESTNLNAPTSIEPNSSRSMKDSRPQINRTKHNLVQISCQTDVSIHPDIDISKFLGEMFLVRQENCTVHNSSSKLNDSNSTPKKQDTTQEPPIHHKHSPTTTTNSLSTQRDDFYDVKYIQNSTANDVLDAFQQLDLSHSPDGSLSQVTNEITSKRKNLHVTFKDDVNCTMVSTGNQPSSGGGGSSNNNNNNSLPNPLHSITPMFCNSNNNLNEHYSLKTPPFTLHLCESTTYHDTPFVSSKKQPISCTTSPRNNNFHSSMVDVNDNLQSTTTSTHMQHFNSNLSSPSWNLTMCNESYFNPISPGNRTKKGSPLADLDDLDKCFGSIDTSPIKLFQVFNSTTTTDVMNGNDDGEFAEKCNKNILKFGDNYQSTEFKISKSSQSTTTHSGNGGGSAIESGYSSNATSVTTSSNHTNNNNTTNHCGHKPSSCECHVVFQ